MVRYFLLSLVIICSISFKADDVFKTINNETTIVQLAINKNGVPFIQQVADKETRTIYFSDASEGMLLQNRLANNFLYEKTNIKPGTKWQVSEDSIFIKVQASVVVNQYTATMHVDLTKATSLLTRFRQTRQTA